MATLLDAKSEKKRDAYTALPEDIFADESKNGRAFPHTEEAIKRRAESIMTHGQKTPVKVRTTVDPETGKKRRELAHGFLRYKAICYINENKLTDEPIRIRYEVDNLNDEATFIDNVVENLDNEQVTPLDHAFNQQKLRDHYDYSDKQIAELYRQQQSSVSQLKKLLSIPSKIQKAVHEGKLAWTVAIGFAELSEEEALKKFEEAKQSDGKISTAGIKDSVRKQRQKRGKGSARSIRDIRKFSDAQIARFQPSDENEGDEALSSFFSSLREYVDGKTGEQALMNAISRLREAEKTEEVAAETD